MESFHELILWDLSAVSTIRATLDAIMRTPEWVGWDATVLDNGGVTCAS